MSDENLRFDDAIIGWSDTTPDSATASSTSGGGYIKLDDSFLTGETIVTLPVSKKLYAVDDNGNLKKDDNGNAIEASWNEQSLHKLRKGFITSVSSSPLSLVYKVGSQGVGFLARTTTINLAVAAATRFSNRRQRSKYITCDATFINPNEPASLISTSDAPGRFTIKNAKLNVLSLEPQYFDSEVPDTTISNNRKIADAIMYEIAPKGALGENVIGHLNIGLDFETISRTEAWDTFLNEAVGTRVSDNRNKFGIGPAKLNSGAILLELNIHQNGLKSSSNQAIRPHPTFSFFVVLLPRDNLKVEYDTSSPYVYRNYSFQIVEPPEDDIRFNFLGVNEHHTFMQNKLGGDKDAYTYFNFTLSGHLPKDEPIKIREKLQDDMSFTSPFVHQDKSQEGEKSSVSPYAFTYTGSYATDFSTADICVIFKINDVVMLANGDGRPDFDKEIGKIRMEEMEGYFNNNGRDYTPEYHGLILAKKIQKFVTEMNAGLRNWNDFFHPSFMKECSIPFLTIRKRYGYKTVVTHNFFDFAVKGYLDFLGIQLLDNSWKDSVSHNSLTSSVPSHQSTNHITMAVYFKKNNYG